MDGKKPLLSSDPHVQASAHVPSPGTGKTLLGATRNLASLSRHNWVRNVCRPPSTDWIYFQGHLGESLQVGAGRKIEGKGGGLSCNDLCTYYCLDGRRNSQRGEAAAVKARLRC